LDKFLSKFFGRKKTEASSLDTKPVKVLDEREEPTIPISDEYFTDTELAALTNENEFAHLVVGCAQSVGLQREHNEDALFTLTSNITDNHDSTLLGIFIVADGMGGHKHGELASEIAVRSMGSKVLNKVFAPLLAENPTPPEDSLQEILQNSILDAHRAIIREAPGGGTTLTAVLIVSERAIIAHVGDSRAYSIPANGEIQALTRDHSLVMRMMELGQLSPEEAAIHPQRNVLYRALGQGEPFDPDMSSFPLPAGGHILICSDGLWGVVSEEVITQIVDTAADPQTACQRLIDAANAAGGPDNITAILIRLPD
jgi:serine/threonine protein phosphatase PrpC